MCKHIVAAYCANGGINAVRDETLERLDIVYYAFGAVRGSNIVFHYPEDLKRVREIKSRHPDLKLILSVGGGGGGKYMTEAVATEESFGKLIDNIFKAMLDNGFDGIDIDWEFPTTTGHPEEQQKHTEMLRRLRVKLDMCDEKKYLSAAVPVGGWVYKITEIDKSHIYLDFINLMTYDLTDFKYTSHHAAPYSSTAGADFAPRSAYDSIKSFKEHGIPAEKLIIGGAFYSKKWDNIEGGIHGLGVPVDVPIEYGSTIYTLREEYINKNGYIRYWDEQAKAPYLYNGSTFITYEDEESLAVKCDMIKSEDILGIMIWELAGDREQKLLPFMKSLLEN